MTTGRSVRKPEERTLNPAGPPPRLASGDAGAGGGPRTDDCDHFDDGFKKGFKKGALPLYTPSFILAVLSNRLVKAPFGIILDYSFAN
jgi:hypothetical protein